MKFTKPKILISKCLEFDTCRFDNQYLINQSFLNPFPAELIETDNSRFF